MIYCYHSTNVLYFSMAKSDYISYFSCIGVVEQTKHKFQSIFPSRFDFTKLCLPCQKTPVHSIWSKNPSFNFTNIISLIGHNIMAQNNELFCQTIFTVCTKNREKLLHSVLKSRHSVLVNLTIDVFERSFSALST